MSKTKEKSIYLTFLGESGGRSEKQLRLGYYKCVCGEILELPICRVNKGKPLSCGCKTREIIAEHQRGNLNSLVYKEKFPDNDTMLGYVCGIIASDGCLVKNSRVITISMHKNDEDFLINLSEMISYNKARIFSGKGRNVKI